MYTSSYYSSSNQPFYQPYDYQNVPVTYPTCNYPSNYDVQNDQDGDRLIGAGFAAPFLLGGLAGAAIAPAFYRPYYGGYYPYYPYPRYY